MAHLLNMTMWGRRQTSPSHCSCLGQHNMSLHVGDHDVDDDDDFDDDHHDDDFDDDDCDCDRYPPPIAHVLGSIHIVLLYMLMMMFFMIMMMEIVIIVRMSLSATMYIWVSFCRAGKMAI